MTKPKILVTRRWPLAVEAQLAEKFDVSLNRSDKPLSASEFQDALKSYDAVLPTVTDQLSARAFEVKSPMTRLLANYGVGYSHIHMPSVVAHHITVTNTPDVLSQCTADLAMTLLLMVARRAGEGERQLRSGNWKGWCPTHMTGTKVTGKTLGIIGFGRIGQEMAARARFGFGMKIIVYSRSPVAHDILARFKAEQVGSIEDLLPHCDFVSLHCPGGPENTNLINATRLNLMKPDAFLINTARGEVVDEKALAHALWFNTIGGAALDVFTGEPNINPDLVNSENLVMLPHMGSATREAREAMGFRVIVNLTDFFAGKEPRDKVDASKCAA